VHGYTTDTYIEPLSIGQDDFVEHGQYDAHRSNQPPGQCHEWCCMDGMVCRVRPEIPCTSRKSCNVCRYSFFLLQILLATFNLSRWMLDHCTVDFHYLLWCSAGTVLTMCLDEGCTACIAGVLSTCCSSDRAWFSHHPVRGEVLYHCVAMERKQGVTHSFFQQWHIHQYIILNMVFILKPEWNIILTK